MAAAITLRWGDPKELGLTPARTHRPTGIVWLNPAFVPRINAIARNAQEAEAIWYFIMKHEEGHVVLQTTDENKADEYASNQYFNKYGKMPSASVTALTKILPFNTGEQTLRAVNQYKRAYSFDCFINGHGPACNVDAQLNNGGYSSFTANCNHFLLSSRRKACEAENQRDRDAEQKKLDAAYNLQALKINASLQQTSANQYILTAADLATIEAEKQLALDDQKRSSQPLDIKKIALVGLLGIAALVVVFIIIK